MPPPPSKGTEEAYSTNEDLISSSEGLFGDPQSSLEQTIAPDKGPEQSHMNSMKTCNSVMFYFMKKLIF